MVASDEAAPSVVAHGFGGPVILEVRQRDMADGRAVLVQQRDAAAELDHAFVPDVDPVVVVAELAPDLGWVPGWNLPATPPRYRNAGCCECVKDGSGGC